MRTELEEDIKEYIDADGSKLNLYYEQLLKKDEEKKMTSENVDRAMEFMLKLREGLFAEPLTVLARMLDVAEKRGYESAALELMEKSDERD